MVSMLYNMCILILFCLSDATSQKDQRINRVNAARSRILYRPSLATSIQMMESAQRKDTVPVKVNRARQDTGMKTLYAKPIVAAAAIPKVKIVQNGTADVFFFLDIFNNERTKYIRKEYFWMLPQVASLHASESDLRIHILSSNVEILEKASNMGLYSHELSYSSANYGNLRSKIDCVEDNDVTTARLLRWKAYNDIVTEWNAVALESPIKRIVAVEDDVLLTVNPTHLFNAAFNAAFNTLNANATFAVQNVAPEVVSIAGSAALFSPEGLCAFSTYIDAQYKNTDTATATLANPSSNVKSLAVDMILLERFINASTTSSRQSWFAPTTDPKTRAVQTAALGCLPLENYRLLPEIQLEVNGTAVKGQDGRGRRTAYPRGAIHIRSVEQAYPYCFLRFKERTDKPLIYAYGRALQILQGKSESEFPLSAVDNLSGDLLLSPENSKEVYYIHSNNTRYFLPTLEAFKSQSFVFDDVISNVPMPIIAAFGPDPQPSYPWQNGEAVQFGKLRTIFYVHNNLLCPIANMQVFARLNVKFENIQQHALYSGPVFGTLPFGPEIK